MDFEGKIHRARQLCLDIGAIAECDIHEGEYSDSLEYLDPEELAKEILKHNREARNDFNNKAEMVSCIEEVMNSAGDECGYCAKNSES